MKVCSIDREWYRKPMWMTIKVAGPCDSSLTYYQPLWVHRQMSGFAITHGGTRLCAALRCRGFLHEKSAALHNGGIGLVRGVVEGRGRHGDPRVGFELWPGHFAIVMLGTPTRGTSLTVIWNKRYSIWKASRFQRASGPVVFTA